MKKTAIEIIDETVSFYSADPVGRRASYKNESGYQKCEYLTKDGRMCAVGRCVEDPQVEWEGRIDRITIENTEIITPVFKEDYKDQPIKLWEELQNLHDDNCNWTETGLSSFGIAQVEALKEMFKNQ